MFLPNEFSEVQKAAITHNYKHMSSVLLKAFDRVCKENIELKESMYEQRTASNAPGQ